MKLPKHIKRITFVIIALLVIAIAVIPKYQAASKPKAQVCLDAPYEVLAKSDPYRVIREESEIQGHGHHHRQILVSINDGICSVLNNESAPVDYPFSRYIDEETAILLNVQLFERTIEEVGGKAAFEKGFEEFAKTPDPETKKIETLYMPSDKYAALKQLGVKIPANVKSADKPKEHPKPTSKPKPSSKPTSK